MLTSSSVSLLMAGFYATLCATPDERGEISAQLIRNFCFSMRPHMVGLVKVIIPFTFDSLTEDTCSFSYYSGKSKKWIDASLNGFFPTVSSLIIALNETIQAEDKDFLRFSVQNQKLCLKCVEGYVIQKMTKKLRNILNLPPGEIESSYMGTAEINPLAHITCFYVHCSFIESQFVNSSSDRILAVVPVLSSQPDAAVEMTPCTRDYFPLTLDSWSRLKIQLLDLDGDPVIFRSGKVVIQLHFSPILV